MRLKKLGFDVDFSPFKVTFKIPVDYSGHAFKNFQNSLSVEAISVHTAS